MEGKKICQIFLLKICFYWGTFFLGGGEGGQVRASGADSVTNTAAGKS